MTTLQDVEDAQLTAAYASGRADERAEWLPVLEALRAALAQLEAKAA